VRSRGKSVEIAGAKPMLDRLSAEMREKISIHPYVPSLAYRIALVAKGSMDATFVKPYSHDWDLAAADLILSEAGGLLVDAQGNQPFLAGPDSRKGSLVAGSG